MRTPRIPVLFGALIAVTVLDASAAAAQRRPRPRFLTHEQSFQVRSGEDLLVDVYDGDVEIRTGPADQVSLKVFVAALDEEWAAEVAQRMALQARRQGTRVVIEARDPRIRDWEWRQYRGTQAIIEVTVPPTFNLDIGSGDGDVGVSDIEGRIEIETGDGDIRAGELRGPEIFLRSADGDIAARSLAAPQITIHTQDGDVWVEAISGALRASSGDGDLMMRLVEPQAVSVRTHDGDITVHAPPSLGAEVELRGEDIWVSREFVIEGQVRGRHVRGRMNAGGPRLTLTTSDGTIRLRSSGGR